MKTIPNITYPVFALFALGCLALAPQARATCQEGCLPNGNTVLGADALISNTTGFENTATGAGALFYSTAGYANTANGASALLLNTNGNDNTAVGDSALVNKAARTILGPSVSGRKGPTPRRTSQELGRHRLLMAVP